MQAKHRFQHGGSRGVRSEPSQIGRAGPRQEQCKCVGFRMHFPYETDASGQFTSEMFRIILIADARSRLQRGQDFTCTGAIVFGHQSKDLDDECRRIDRRPAAQMHLANYRPAQSMFA